MINATGFILIAVVFDFLDGFSARALGVESPMGAQLDSLADLVTFGVAPAMMFLVLMEAVLLSKGNIGGFM